MERNSSLTIDDDNEGNVTIRGSIARDTITLAQDAVSKELSVITGNAWSLYSQAVLDIPAKSLTIDAAGAYDTIFIVSDIHMQTGASLIITGGGTDLGDYFANLVPGLNFGGRGDKIIIKNNVTISTAGLNGTVGKIQLEASTIEISTGAKLLARTDIDGIASASADIKLFAKDQGLAELEALSPLIVETKQASINIADEAVIDGKNLIISSIAEDAALVELIGDWKGSPVSNSGEVFGLQPFLEQISEKLALPIKILVKATEASVLVGENTQLRSIANVVLEAEAKTAAGGSGGGKRGQIKGSAKAFGSAFSLAVIVADADAKVVVESGATIDAGGAVLVKSSASSIAALSANVANEEGNSSFGIAISVDVVTVVSHVMIAKEAVITAGTTANITAIGEALIDNSTEVSVIAGIPLRFSTTISVSSTNIKNEVLGLVVANASAEGSTVAFEFDPTAEANQIGHVGTNFGIENTIYLGKHALNSGDFLSYDNKGGEDIAGLLSGNDYFLVALPDIPSTPEDESQLIQLANTKTAALTAADKWEQALLNNAVDNSGVDDLIIKFEWGPVIGAFASEAAMNEKKFSVTDDVKNNTITVSNESNGFLRIGAGDSPFVAGQPVRYNVPDDNTTPIGGLQNGTVYYIIIDTDAFEANRIDFDGDSGLLDSQVIKLAETDAKANAGIYIELDPSTATGEHSLSAYHVLDSELISGVGVNSALVSSISGVAVSLDDNGGDDETNDFGNDGISYVASGGFFKTIVSAPKMLYEKITDKTKILNKAKEIPVEIEKSRSGFNFSAATVVNVANNSVVTNIGPSAVLKSAADLKVSATITQEQQLNAESDVSLQKDIELPRISDFDFSEAADRQDYANKLQEYQSVKNATKYSGSISVIVGVYNNGAIATVAPGAKLDAINALQVISDVSYPTLTRLDEFFPSTFADVLKGVSTENLDFFSDYLDGTFGLKSKLFNSWARSTTEGEKVGIAGTVNVLIFNNTSKVLVGLGVEINQDQSFIKENTEHLVSVEATNYMQLFNLTGVFNFDFNLLSIKKSNQEAIKSKKFKEAAKGLFTTTDTDLLAGKSEKSGVGGAVFVMNINNATQAIISDGASISSGSNSGFNVKAEEKLWNFNFSQAGGEGGEVALGGTVAVVNQSSDTLAQLDSDAQVTGQSVSVEATSLVTNINWAGGVAKSESIGAGVSVAVNNINRRTRAIIGRGEPSTGPPVVIASDASASINVAGDITVKATADGVIWAFTVAASLSSSSGESTPTEGKAEQSKGSAGALSFGGAFSINNINTDSANQGTQAFISDQAVIEIAGSVVISADDRTGFTALVGGIAAAWVKSNVSSGNNGSAGIGIALAVNKIEHVVQAFIDNAYIKATGGDVTVTAKSISEMLVITLGAAFAAAASNQSAGSLAIGGAFSFNTINASILAGIRNQSRVDSKSLSLDAADESTITAISVGGAIAFSKGKSSGAAAVGAVFAKNTVKTDVRAWTDHSKVDSSTTVMVKGSSQSTINAVSVAASVAVSFAQQKGISFSGGGVGSVNQISSLVNAYASNSHINAVGAIDLNAVNASAIEAVIVAASLSGSKSGGAVAIGVSVAKNYIGWVSDDTTKVDYTSNQGSQSLSSGDTVRISSGVLAGDVYEYLGNSPVTIDLASADYGDPNTWKRINLQAAPSQVRAYIANSTIQNSGDLKITARSTQTIDAVVVAGAVGVAGGGDTGVAVSVAGSISLNAIKSEIRASIEGSVSTINASSITLSAWDQSAIDSVVVAGAIAAAFGKQTGVSVAVGVAYASNEVANQVDASIRDTSNITASGAITIDARALPGKTDTADYTTADGTQSLSEGDRVEVKPDYKGGGQAGRVYQYRGSDADLDLGKQDYSNSTLWMLDDVSIFANTIGGSIAISSGNTGVSLAIAVSLSRNKIDNTLEASIQEATTVTAQTVSLEAVNNTTIVSTAVAASIALSIAKQNAFAISGGGVGSINEIASTTKAHATNSAIVAGGAVTIEATDTSTIQSLIVAAAVGSLSIGGAKAENHLIGWDSEGKQTNAQVLAYLKNTPINEVATGTHGALTLTATSNQTINANVIAGSVGFTAGFDNSAALSGAGSDAVNKIAVEVKAYIDGTSAIHATALTLTATEKSTITANVVGASLSAALSGGNSLAIAVGVSLSENIISNTVEAAIQNAATVDSDGTVTLRAVNNAKITANTVAASIAVSVASQNAISLSGGGARSINQIASTTKAHATNSAIVAGGAVTIEATDTSTIQSLIVAAAVGSLSIGGAKAENHLIGWDSEGKQTNAQVLAYLKNTPINEVATGTHGALTLTATSNQTIRANVIAGAVGFTVGFNYGAALSGAGSDALNKISVTVKAYINGDEEKGINAASISLRATDTSSITANTVGAAVSAALSGSASGSIAIGISLAKNEIANIIEASVQNADAVVSAGNIDIRAINQASIRSVSVAASLAGTFGSVGVSVSGAGADSHNVIHTKTNAFAQESKLTSRDGNVTIVAVTGSAGGSQVLPLPGGKTPDKFTEDLDDAATPDMLEKDMTINGKDYAKGTPNPTDYDEDKAIKKALRDQLATIGIELSSDPDDIAITTRKVDTGVSSTDDNDDSGTEWSVTDRSSAISVIIAKDLSENFTVMKPQISAHVIGASAALAVGAKAGVGIAIGVSLARNLIGTQQSELGGLKSAASIEEKDSAESQAQIIDASVIAPKGSLTLNAIGQQSIDAFVGAFAGAAAGGAGGGFAGAGAGSRATNAISIKVKATIAGNHSDGINVGTLSLRATDSSSIKAVTGAVTVAFSAGYVGASIGVGVSIAENVILNMVDAHIAAADYTVQVDGEVTIIASETASIDAYSYAASLAISLSIGGAGAVGVLKAENLIKNSITAYIDGSTVDAKAVTARATDTAIIVVETFSLSLAGGSLVAVAVDVGDAINTIKNTVSAYASGATISTKAGDLRIQSDSDPTIKTTSTAVAVSAGLGALAVATFNASTRIEGKTEAYLNASTVNTDTHNIHVTATSTENLTPLVRGGAGAATVFGGLSAAATVMLSDAKVAGSTEARLSGSSTLTANQVHIQATDTSTAKPETNVGSAGLVAVSVASTKATLTRQTLALIESNARITLSSSSLILGATSATTAYTTSRSTGGGLISVANLNIDSTVNSTTKAKVGTGATISVSIADTDITVSADSQNLAIANTMNYGGGGVNVQNSTPKATNTSTTEASMLGDLTSLTGNGSGGTCPNGSKTDSATGARNLVVRSTANDRSIAGASTAGGGLVQVGVATVEAVTTPTVNAKIGGRVQVINDIKVTANSRTDADVTNSSASGGGVAVTALNATVTLNPIVNAAVVDAANLSAGNNLTILAIHGETAPVINSSDEPDDADGKADASASSAAGGAVQVSSVNTTVAVRPEVTTIVGSGAKLTAVRKLDIQSKAFAKAKSIAEGDGGGLLSVGISDSMITINPSSTVQIEANAILRAPGDDSGTIGSIDLVSTTSVDSEGKGRGVSGGLVAVAGATVTTNVSYSSTIQVNDSAVLETNGDLLVESRSDVTAKTDSSVTAGGGVAVATNTTTLNLGQSADKPATTVTNIGDNAMLKGGKVKIGAKVTKLHLTNKSSETAGGAGSGATAEALTTIHNKTKVHLESGSSVIAGDLVEIYSTHDDIKLESEAKAFAAALIGVPNAEAKIDYQSLAHVLADVGARVAGGVVNISARNEVTRYTRKSREYAWQNGTGANGEKSGALNARREIEWNGNLAIFSPQNPQLVVDANGMISTATNVTVDGQRRGESVSGLTVSVDPIFNDADLSGDITFTTSAQQTKEDQTSPGGIIIGTNGSISTGTAFTDVSITNNSDKHLVINGIQPVNPDATPTINLNVENVSGFDFTVGNTSIPPTDIVIINNGSGDVILNAPSGEFVPGTTDKGFSIYNPIGTTKIVAKDGAIRNKSAAPAATPSIWTRTLDLEASGAVGTMGSREGCEWRSFSSCFQSVGQGLWFKRLYGVKPQQLQERINLIS